MGLKSLFLICEIKLLNEPTIMSKLDLELAFSANSPFEIISLAEIFDIPLKEVIIMLAGSFADFSDNKSNSLSLS